MECNAACKFSASIRLAKADWGTLVDGISLPFNDGFLALPFWCTCVVDDAEVPTAPFLFASGEAKKASVGALVFGDCVCIDAGFPLPTILSPLRIGDVKELEIAEVSSRFIVLVCSDLVLSI